MRTCVGVSQECIRLLVDAFAVDVNVKDNAGRTPMATLVLRHKSSRAGVGPHAREKIAMLESLGPMPPSASMLLDDTVRCRGGCASLPPCPSHALCTQFVCVACVAVRDMCCCA
jgi:hypothetical protein